MSHDRFLTTHWSVVLAAGQHSSPAARAALAVLCERYWYPIYAFVRRRGVSADQAQDVTQDFFARLLEKQALQAADPDRGRFRSFLLTAAANFLSNYRDHAGAPGLLAGIADRDLGSGDSDARRCPPRLRRSPPRGVRDL